MNQSRSIEASLLRRLRDSPLEVAVAEIDRDAPKDLDRSLQAGQILFLGLAEDDFHWDTLARDSTRVVGKDDPAFPARLRDNPDPPCWLFAQGNLAALNSPAKVAIVGSRDSRTTGIDTARQRAGLVVCRGLGIASVSAPR